MKPEKGKRESQADHTKRLIAELQGEEHRLLNIDRSLTEITDTEIELALIVIRKRIMELRVDLAEQEFKRDK